MHFHFTPTGSGWINQIDTWFGIATRQAIRWPSAAAPSCVQVLIRTIRDDITACNANPRPFHWTATADEILAKAQLVQTSIKQLVDNNAE